MKTRPLIFRILHLIRKPVATLLCVALASLGVLAALAICLAGLPPWLKPPLAVLAAWHGLRLARAHWRLPACSLLLADDGTPPVMQRADACAELPGAQLSLRGPLAALAWRRPDGRRDALCWCADTLPPAARRELRLRLGAPGRASA